jgi:hypothetical protein
MIDTGKEGIHKPTTKKLKQNDKVQKTQLLYLRERVALFQLFLVSGHLGTIALVLGTQKHGRNSRVTLLLYMGFKICPNLFEGHRKFMNLPPRKEDQSYTYSLRAGGIIPPTRHKNPPIYTTAHDNVHLRIEVR